MKKLYVLMLAAALAACLSSHSEAAVVAEDFSRNPMLSGWKIHGASQLFTWDEPKGSLQVTWDSALTNSYFYRPLGMVLTKADEFSLAFDLRLDEVTLGSFELAIGLLNFSDATQPGFLRGTGSDSPNLAEFDYFPEWSSVDATTSDTEGAMQFNYGVPVTLQPGTTYRIVLKHAAGDGMLAGEIYLGEALYDSMPKSFTNANFTDFRVDTLAVASYSGVNSFAELYARGAVDNLVLTIPLAVGEIDGRFAGVPWQVKVSSNTNSNYILQRTADFEVWADVGTPLPGTGSELLLTDPNPPATEAYYRVKATQ
jgi:hypothetical protein